MAVFNFEKYNLYADPLEKNLSAALKKLSFSKIIILTDTNTNEHCLPLLFQANPQLKNVQNITIPAGERHKRLTTCTFIWKNLQGAKVDRQSILINLGGGVTGDIGGFAAAVYKRGVRYIHIPTSLLAQCDASIGGKTGVDFEGVKNQLGSFHDPIAVFTDTRFLETLPEEEMKSGLAEMIKHSLIADSSHLEYLQKIKNIRSAPWHNLLPHTIAIKKKIIEEDPFEKGIRKLLNFGHTAGHALESLYLEKNESLPHGFAVAAGIIIESHLSFQKEQLGKKELDQICEFIDRFFPRIKVVKNDFSYLIKNMEHDKKNDNSKINFTLLNGIGKGQINVECSKKEIRKAFDFYNDL